MVDDEYDVPEREDEEDGGEPAEEKDPRWALAINGASVVCRPLESMGSLSRWKGYRITIFDDEQEAREAERLSHV